MTVLHPRRHVRLALGAGVMCILGLTSDVGGRALAQHSADVQSRVKLLSDAVNRVQSQIDASQRELTALREELEVLKQGTDARASRTDAEPAGAGELASAVAAIRETQSLQETQIATLAQTKVESESKYPLKVTGLVLMTASVNTSRVDSAQTPAVALGGSGSTAATVRQTVLGIDARGPHIFGAESHADLHIDFDAPSAASSYGGYALGLVRLKTLHAELAWTHARAFFSLDRSLLSPQIPTSLTAVAVPALAWSGNLWTWNPQLGISRDWLAQKRTRIRTEFALIDVADPPALNSVSASSYAPPATSEMSRWPGVEGRLALVSADEMRGLQVGVSGFTSSHRTGYGTSFTSWAAATDLRLPVSRIFEISASAYRGMALGGLGAGAYKDYVARSVQGEYSFRALDDSGGWLQLKQRAGDTLEFNQSIGIDDVPAAQLRPYAIPSAVNFLSLTRNRTATANLIYSPSAYLLFTLEYRRVASSYVSSPTLFSDIIGIGAGYRF